MCEVPDAQETVASAFLFVDAAAEGVVAVLEDGSMVAPTRLDDREVEMN
jgi:hypothetical protein